MQHCLVLSRKSPAISGVCDGHRNRKSQKSLRFRCTKAHCLHVSPNETHPRCNFKPQIWLANITSRDAKSACFTGERLVHDKVYPYPLGSPHLRPKTLTSPILCFSRGGTLKRGPNHGLRPWWPWSKTMIWISVSQRMEVDPVLVNLTSCDVLIDGIFCFIPKAFLAEQECMMWFSCFLLVSVKLEAFFLTAQVLGGVMRSSNEGARPQPSTASMASIA